MSTATTREPGSRLARTLRRGLLALAALAALLAGAVVAVSEWRLRRTHDVPIVAFRPAAPVDLAEGLRMAKIVGCWAGCHGPEGQGGDASIPGIVRQTAPTLSAVLPGYTDDELVRLIRYGIKRDGRSALGMISYTFWPLGDRDLANIIAHPRRQPALPPVARERELTALGRLALALGEWQMSAAQVDRSIPRWGELPRTTAFERGRYLASITCSECHGLDFAGNPQEGGPSLAVVGAYSPEAFRHLLRTGEPLSKRDLGIMGRTARAAFALFSAEEIADIHLFLRRHHGIDATAR